jgi:eukaryotic-like serine/threonine-protein kinase
VSGAGETDRRRRALGIFDAVADLADDLRARRADELCGDDDRLRAQVRALLAADDDDTEILSGGMPSLRELAGAAGAIDGDATGRRVGAWRITGILGRGGMGAVYAVERADGAYAQQAALKLIRSGQNSAGARGRFLRERQTLARLRHPNIATLLDGGFSDADEPYFVMERVDGVPIDQWCDARSLGLEARVALVLQVLDAVQYAHRNLVVHRDLKPSNVLVTAEGQVKLLDFGIAKQLQDAESTATDDRALTFAYASPEQLHDAPITTATDVWQLGIVLHRLLAGAHPFGVDRDTPLARQLQMLEREPEPLSKAAMLAGPEVAARRGHSPASLARALGGDLSDIVRGCLRRAPEQRYPSVEALADDLRRWREHRPLRIAPPSRIDAARLWLRRHRTAAWASAAVVVALLSGAGAALWQAREAREQARIAGRESANARAALAFLTATLGAAAPGRAMSTEVSVRELLDQARAELDAQQAMAPQVRQPVQRMLGHLYGALGESEASAGLFEAGLAGVRPGTRDEALALVADLDGHASVLAVLERGQDSLAAARQGAALRARFAPDDLRQRFLGERQEAIAYSSLADCKQADAAWARALSTAEAIPGLPVADVADAHVAYARMLFGCGEYARGLGIAEHGLADADRRALPAWSPSRAGLLWVKATNGHAIDRISDADSEALLRQAIAIQARVAGPGGTQMAEYYSALGAQLQTIAGRMEEALALHERSAELQRAAGTMPISQGITQYNIGYLYVDYGDYPKGLAAHERSLEIFDAAGVDPDHIERRRSEKWYARALIYAGRAEEGRQRLSRLQERARTLDGEDSVEYMDVVWQQLRAAVQLGDVDRGMPLLAETRTRARRFVPESHPVFIEFLRADAQFASLRGDVEGAGRMRREALAKVEALDDPLGLAVVRAELAQHLARHGDRAEARRLLAEALPVLRQHLLPTHLNRARFDALAGQLRL